MAVVELGQAKFGSRIRWLRRIDGRSVPELARTAGVHHHSLRNIEAGTQSPTLGTLCRILGALDAPLAMVAWSDADFEEYLKERMHYRLGEDGQPGAQNVYLAHHDQWALAQVS